MRIKLYFETNTNEIEGDIKRSFISFMKKTLSEYDENIYHYLYKRNQIKPYSFSVYLPGVIKEATKTKINNNFVIFEISVLDSKFACHFYNALQKNKNKSYPFGSALFVCKKITAETSKQCQNNKIIIKLKSPLVLRKRVGNKDTYYTYKDNEFNNIFNELVNYQLSTLGLPTDPNIKIKTIEGKTVMDKIFGLCIYASAGIYMLEGDKEVLTILSQTGIGSRRSEGYGLFNVLTEV